MKIRKYCSPFVIGTLFLTVSGILSRCLGFVVRVFMSHTLGEEAMGIYSLALPVFSIGVSMCGLGIQTALSRMIAEYSQKAPDQGRYLLRTALTLSLTLSLSFSVIVFLGSDLIAGELLQEMRCAGLLRMLSLSMPFCCIHACCCGFFYGHGKAKQPAFSQLMEETVRTASLLFIWLIRLSQTQSFTLTDAVFGTLLSEICSSLYIWSSRRILYLSDSRRTFTYPQAFRELAKTAAPISGSRLVTALLTGAEHMMIPFFLRRYGLSDTQALSVFGVLSGMAMPFILFPCTVTNAMSVLLMPKIASAGASKELSKITFYTRGSIGFSLGMGCAFTGLFYLIGPFLGPLCFGSRLAGQYIQLMSLLCPFLYLGATCSSILNGLGRMSQVFVHTVLSLFVRLLSVAILIPMGGINGYLLGLLTSQLLLCVLHIGSIRRCLSDSQAR